MPKRDLSDMTIQELRRLAKKKGLAARRDWKKKDFIKALSAKKVSGKRAAKAPPLAKRKPRRSRTASGPPAIAAASRTARKTLSLQPLPAEYNDSRIVSMPVTPRQLYVYWEVPEEKFSEYKGSLNLKAVDTVTYSFFYTPVSGRIGECFINIDPDSRYSIEIGVINGRGEFVNIGELQPAAASEVAYGMPAPETSVLQKTRALSEEFFKTPDSISSY